MVLIIPLLLENFLEKKWRNVDQNPNNYSSSNTSLIYDYFNFFKGIMSPEDIIQEIFRHEWIKLDLQNNNKGLSRQSEIFFHLRWER